MSHWNNTKNNIRQMNKIDSTKKKKKYHKVNNNSKIANKHSISNVFSYSLEHTDRQIERGRERRQRNNKKWSSIIHSSQCECDWAILIQAICFVSNVFLYFECFFFAFLFSLKKETREMKIKPLNNLVCVWLVCWLVGWLIFVVFGSEKTSMLFVQAECVCVCLYHQANQFLFFIYHSYLIRKVEEEEEK